MQPCLAAATTKSPPTNDYNNIILAVHTVSLSNSTWTTVRPTVARVSGSTVGGLAGDDDNCTAYDIQLSACYAPLQSAFLSVSNEGFIVPDFDNDTLDHICLLVVPVSHVSLHITLVLIVIQF